jgi:3-hydroxy-9,10-secoandrosta-1,3,5(10)-triene-9,17-dione monooxygenase reductase component
MKARAARDVLDPHELRHVFGHHPTGVCAITALNDRTPCGMAVGSFASVSLDPPLVAFLPDRASTSFPDIRRSGSFVVNVLGADQESVCRAFATKGGDKFAGLTWTTSELTSSPVLDGIIAWVDCDIEQVIEAGDHYVVLGRVLGLSVVEAKQPLIFFRGEYGSYLAESAAL